MEHYSSKHSPIWLLILTTLYILAGCVVPGRSPFPLYVRWRIWVNANVTIANLPPNDLVAGCAIYNPYTKERLLNYSMEPCKSDPEFVEMHEANHALQQSMMGWTNDELVRIFLAPDKGIKYEHDVDCMTEALMQRPMVGGNGYGDCAGAEVIAMYSAMDRWLN